MREDPSTEHKKEDKDNCQFKSGNLEKRLTTT